MNVANQTRHQIAATLFTFASLIGAAAFAPNAPVGSEVQSFIGTVPSTSAVEAQAATF